MENNKLKKNIKFFDEYKEYKRLNFKYRHRKISIYNFKNIKLNGISLNYPLVLLDDNVNFILPIREKFMSLNRGTIYEKSMIFDGQRKKERFINRNNLFFFIYNSSNYYHFIYDTLPALISFRILKKEIKNLKLLTYPPLNMTDNMSFFYETLNLFGINKKDIIKANDLTLYTSLFISTSFTHAGKSNRPPHPEIFNFYNNIKINSNKNYKYTKIYISRRTWSKTKNSNNIGTDYTIRRKCINEDQVFEIFQKFGFKEIFAEDLSMKDKILIFKNAKFIAGTIGGGMVNVIFSKPTTTVFSINSPNFFKVNKRFKYSLAHTNLINFNHTKFTKKIVKEKDEGKMALSISGGINSPWIVDLNKLNKKLSDIF